MPSGPVGATHALGSQGMRGGRSMTLKHSKDGMATSGDTSGSPPGWSGK